MPSNKPCKIELAAKTKGICIICGKYLTTLADSSIEHFIPRAIYKWIDEPHLVKLLENKSNLFLVHIQCNFRKDATLPTLAKIQALPACESIQAELCRLYEAVEPAIIRYQAIKRHILHDQKHQCAVCRKQINMLSATLRRKNNEEARSQNNAVCLCFSCSTRLGNKQLKSIMLGRKPVEPDIGGLC